MYIFVVFNKSIDKEKVKLFSYSDFFEECFSMNWIGRKWYVYICLFVWCMRGRDGSLLCEVFVKKSRIKFEYFYVKVLIFFVKKKEGKYVMIIELINNCLIMVKSVLLIFIFDNIYLNMENN